MPARAYGHGMALDLSAAQAALVHRVLWDLLKQVRAGNSVAMVTVDSMFRRALASDPELVEYARDIRVAEAQS